MYFKDTHYDNRLRKYLELDILGKTGITFEELLNMTRFEIENIFRVVSSFGQFKSNLEESEQKKLERKRKIEEDAEKRKREAQDRDK